MTEGEREGNTQRFSTAIKEYQVTHMCTSTYAIKHICTLAETGGGQRGQDGVRDTRESEKAPVCKHSHKVSPLKHNHTHRGTR